MGVHEKIGKSDEWYTPKFIFDALDVVFDLDVASPTQKTNVPAKQFITENSLEKEWKGFVWCNPPFGGRNALVPWVEKFIKHGNGIFLAPDQTSAKWYKQLSLNTEYMMCLDGRVKFVKPDGTTGDSPANGTNLFSIGIDGWRALNNGNKNKLGTFYQNISLRTK